MGARFARRSDSRCRARATSRSSRGGSVCVPSRAPMAARLRHPAAPLVLLVVVSVLSFGLRIAWIDYPWRAPCTTAADHTLVFDEIYYVNAARVIAGLQ